MVGVERKAINKNNNILAANFIDAKIDVNLTFQKALREIYTKINIENKEIVRVNTVI